MSRQSAMRGGTLAAGVAQIWPGHGVRFQRCRERLATGHKALAVALLRFLQTKPILVRTALGKWWCLVGLGCLWFCMLLAPPASLCGLPSGAGPPGPDVVMFFRISSLSSWHTRSVLDLEFLIQRLLSRLPLAADPEQLLQGAGSALFCKTAIGNRVLQIARDGSVRGLADFFAAMDTNKNGLLDRYEVWWLQGLLSLWLDDPDGSIQRLTTGLPRDEEGRVELAKFQASWQTGLSDHYHRFVVVNASTAASADLDEAAFHATFDYMNYVPIGRIEAVGTGLFVPFAGRIVCDLNSDFWYLWWDLSYSMIVAPGILLLIHQLALKLGHDIRRRTRFSFLLLFIAVFGVYFNPLLDLCTMLYLSPEFGKLLTMVLLLSLDEYRRFLAFMEYWMDDNLGDDDQSANFSSVLRTDVRFVRCPLCRRLSNSSQVVRKVHAQIQPDVCCVCLVEQSEVCFVCGHVCMCSGCFEGLLDHRHHDDETPPTVIGNARAGSIQ